MLWWIGGALVLWLLVSVVVALVLARILHVADRDERLVEFQRDRKQRCHAEDDPPTDPDG